MPETVTLGIDFGTSAVKVVAMNDRGKMIASSSAPYPMMKTAPDRAEQDPELWWAALVEASRALTNTVPPTDIKALGLSGQLNGIVLLDGNDELLGPSLIWLDQRCGEESAELDHAFGPELANITGSPSSPIAVLPKLRWLAKHEPERMGQVKQVLQVKDYILWRLTGCIATDANEASASLMMDLESQSWNNKLVSFAKAKQSWLSPIRGSCEIVAGVNSAAAQATGLTEDLPVVPGAGDTGALAVGCNAYAPGVTAVTLGTAGHVVAAVQGIEPKKVAGVWRMAHVSKDRDLWLGLIPSGGLSITWILKTIESLTGQPISFSDLEDLAMQAPPAAAGVSFLPFLEGAGTPWNRADLRAGFHGLNTVHDITHMARAVYEGVAYNLRACIEAFEAAGVPTNRVHVAEGGARSTFWCQLIADILGREVHVIEQGDTSATGAAIMALSAVDDLQLPDAIDQCVSLGQCWHPSAQHQALYQDGWQSFSNLVTRLKVESFSQ